MATDWAGLLKPRERHATPSRRPFNLPPRLQEILDTARPPSLSRWSASPPTARSCRACFPSSRPASRPRPMRDAAEAFLAALTRRAARRPPPSTSTARCGAPGATSTCSDAPRRLPRGADRRRSASAALGLLARDASARSGFETARDVMRLNHTIGEITGSWDEYGEWLYWLSIFGTPSADEPWGWQIDGHHLIVNCFVLGDQVVMTPMLHGLRAGAAPTTASTPARASSRPRRRSGLALMQRARRRAAARTAMHRRRRPPTRSSPRPSATTSCCPTRASAATTLLGRAAGAAAAPRSRPTSAACDPATPRSSMDEVRRHLARHLLRLDRRLRRRQRLLLPHPQPGDPDRVRPPARASRSTTTSPIAQPHPHRGAHAERQRLRQGPAAPALRAQPPPSASRGSGGPPNPPIMGGVRGEGQPTGDAADRMARPPSPLIMGGIRGMGSAYGERGGWGTG